MVCRDTHKRRAHERVGAGCVDFDLVESIWRTHCVKAELKAAGFADPVGLHQLHFGRPVVQAIKGCQQFIGEIADFEEPLGEFTSFNQRARAPAAPCLNLFVGQNGHIDGIPVHHRVLAVDQPFFHHIEEKCLLLAVVFGVTGRKFAGPVEREPERHHLCLHVCDVLVGPFAGVDFAFHRCVFGRQTKGIPAHRVQYVVPRCHLIPRDHVAHCIVAHVAHVDAPRRIGEHFQHVILGFIGAAIGFEQAGFGPSLLPFAFNVCG